MPTEIQKFLAERDRQMREMDIDAAHKDFPMMQRESVEVMLHKVRYEIPSMGRALRQESRAWLEVRGFSRLKQLPWPAADVLED